jgi:hypothetical protein
MAAFTALRPACDDRQVASDPDGTGLLTSDEVADLLAAAIAHAGGSLVSWRLDHVDANPQHSTTATYLATADWPTGRREVQLGASARVEGRTGTDERAVIFGDGDREVAVWLYPNDPDLPALARVVDPIQLATLLTEQRVFPGPIAPRQLLLETITYRPRRRAVVRARVRVPAGTVNLYLKVLRPDGMEPILTRHQLLAAAGIPAPRVVATGPDGLLVLAELPGRSLARALFDQPLPCTAENMIMLLDAMPAAVAALPGRPPWTHAVDHYAELVARSMPELRAQLDWLVTEIVQGLRAIPATTVLEPTHGDFHEGQLFVANGVISGVLDIDTVGPGRRVDDLACLLGHLSSIQRMNADQAAHVNRLVGGWIPVFDQRVDPAELRLRAAAVIISLATGPYRGQEPDWQRETLTMINTAIGLLKSLRR